MARNVSVGFTNWHWTGVEVLTPQAEVDIKIQWISDAGEQREHTETVQFPNVLRDVPARWLKRELEGLLLWAVMKKLDIDPREPRV